MDPAVRISAEAKSLDNAFYSWEKSLQEFCPPDGSIHISINMIISRNRTEYNIDVVDGDGEGIFRGTVPEVGGVMLEINQKVQRHFSPIKEGQ